MLLLTSTSDLVRVVTGSTGDVQAQAAWMDASSGTITAGRTNTASITTATTTTVVGSPGSSTARNVKRLSVFNNHASTSNAVTIDHTDGTNAEVLWKGTLLAGESVVLDDYGDWILYTSAGVPKTASTKLDTKLRVTSDVTNATTSFADITGLTCAVENGKHYGFEAWLIYQTNTSTTGAQFGINGPTMTGMIVSTIQTVTTSATASVHSTGTATARDTAASVQTTGPGASNVLGVFGGWFNPSAAGTFAVRCASEVAVAGGLVIKAGSWVRVFELDN